MNEPIYSMLTGKQCGTRTLRCTFEFGSYAWRYVSGEAGSFPSACNDCNSGYSTNLPPDNNLNTHCGETCYSGIENQECVITYYCN